MAHRIDVPDDLYALLEAQAARTQRSPAQLAADVLRRFLSSSEATWEARLTQVLTMTHAQTAERAPETIEADISAAAAEVRELRRAQRRLA